MCVGFILMVYSSGSTCTGVGGARGGGGNKVGERRRCCPDGRSLNGSTCCGAARERLASRKFNMLD